MLKEAFRTGNLMAKKNRLRVWTCEPYRLLKDERSLANEKVSYPLKNKQNEQKKQQQKFFNSNTLRTRMGNKNGSSLSDVDKRVAHKKHSF